MDFITRGQPGQRQGETARGVRGVLQQNFTDSPAFAVYMLERMAFCPVV